MAYIKDLSYSQPSSWVDSNTIENWTDSKPDFISGKIGNSKRAFLGENETGLDLCESACRRMFEKYETLPKFGLLVVVTQNPDYKLPHMSALLQNRLGFSENVACFDIALGCSGFVYGLKAIEGFMYSQNISDALLVTCDPYSRIMQRQDRDTMTVFGDAAACTWITSTDVEGGAEIKDAVLGTDGSGAEHLIVRSGGSANPSVKTLFGPDPQNSTAEDARLYMNGRAILEFMLTKVPPMVDACLVKNELTHNEVDYYVFHQASGYMIKQLIRRMGLNADKVPILMDTTANTVSSTLPIALDILSSKVELQGKCLVLCGFGVGLSWGCIILQY